MRENDGGAAGEGRRRYGSRPRTLDEDKLARRLKDEGEL